MYGGVEWGGGRCDICDSINKDRFSPSYLLLMLDCEMLSTFSTDVCIQGGREMGELEN